MGKKLTTEQFIEKAKQVHGDKYDYSKVVYLNSKIYVNINCIKHGIFKQKPNIHLNGSGCKKCGFATISKLQTMTTEQFIEKAKQVHGDKYDYSKVKYINSTTKVDIICQKHGIFKQIPNSHLNRMGCKRCGIEKRVKMVSNTTKQFIEKAKQVHGDKYDYSKVKYINNKIKVDIICQQHGIFKQPPNDHLKYECYKCGIIKRNNSNSSTTEEFIEKAKQLHGEKYDYSKVNYQTALGKINIICKEHGIFEQRPNDHLNGQGCYECGVIKYSKSISSNTEEFIKKSKRIHKEKYDYSKVDYKKAKIAVIIICEKHGEFNQTPHNHLAGYGCSDCVHKSESETRKIFEEITGKKFYKTRKVIKKDKIIHELDGYNKELNIAFEYQGEQHYIYLKYFHRKGKFQLLERQIRDYIKAKECKKLGIKLIEVPYWIKDKKEFVFDILKNH